MILAYFVVGMLILVLLPFIVAYCIIAMVIYCIGFIISAVRR